MRFWFGLVCCLTAVGMFSCSETTGIDEPGKAYSPYSELLGNDTLYAGSLNLAVGFSLEDIFLKYPKNDSEAYELLSDLYGQYRASLPEQRMEMAAEAMAGQRLQVIALQEVMRISKNGADSADFLEAIRDELEERSGRKFNTILHPLNHLVLGPYSNGSDTITLDFAEGNAFLIDSSFYLDDSQSNLFADLYRFPIEVLGQKFTSERGLTYARIRSPAGKYYQLFNTHIEAFGDELQKKQVAELLQIIRGRERSGDAHILLGDFNAQPETDIYQAVREERWIDTQEELGEPAEPTFFSSELRLATGTDIGKGMRIDYLFARYITSVLHAAVFLQVPAHPGISVDLYSSDHRLLVSVVESQYEEQN